jgi:hypothetical protein
MIAIRTIAFWLLLIAPVAAFTQDQGAPIFIDSGTDVTLTGEFYFDPTGWGMCLDGRSPEIMNKKVNDVWETTIKCHGHGDTTKTVKDWDGTKRCLVEPTFDMNHRADLWQIHVYCASAVPVS